MSSKFFPSLMRALAAAAAVAAPVFIEQLIAFFQNAIPSDISGAVWAIVSTIVVFLLNYALGQVRKS